MSRILLIEGDPGERLILRSRLTELAHEVLVAESGAQGLVEARAGAVDLVLLSIDLGGGVDCAEVCRRLKATPGRNRVPVLVYANTATSSDTADRMYDAGCEAFIPKAQLAFLDRMLKVHLRLKSHGDEVFEQNRVLDLENRRLAEEQQRAVDLDAAEDSDDVLSLISRELAAGRPDGVLLVDAEGVVRECDRGASELLGTRLVGSTLGRLAPGCGLEAFVRDARTAPREGFRFDISERRDRNPRSLSASVMPVTAGGEGQHLRVVLLIDVGKRRLTEELARAHAPGIPRQQLGALVEAARATYIPDSLVGSSPSIVAIRKHVARLTQLTTPVFVTGEAGTGKQLASRILHYSSPRTGSFLQVRCSALNEEALRAELFGVARGNKQGLAEHPGLLCLARDGTLLLGEVSALSKPLQKDISAAIESHIIRRIGGKRDERVDLRLVATSTRNLDDLVREKVLVPGFADLFGTRLVSMPTLKDRSSDVSELAHLFLTRFGPRAGAETIAEEAIWVLEQYGWPGNVAELEDCIEQACSRVEGDVLEIAHLTRPLRDCAADLPSTLVPARPPAGVTRSQPQLGGAPISGASTTLVARPWAITEDDPISLDLYEKKVLLRALDSTGGDK
ncbi:MAG: sigma 54-interacting transcriptional regulator, partial [Planctomycetota bacterium]|nr:sigma 54-interacting transcriptional regulator [Planctomycetota bacterium]